MRQKNQVELNLGTGAKGEAPSPAARESEARTAKACLERPAVAEPSMEVVVERENLKEALAVPRPPGVRDRLSPCALRTLGRRRLGLHPSRRCPSSVRPDSSAAWFARDRRSTGLFHRSGLRRRAAAYYALG